MRGKRKKKEEKIKDKSGKKNVEKGTTGVDEEKKRWKLWKKKGEKTKEDAEC